MARQWTGTPYQGADGIFHYPWTDTATGESGEELSYEGPTQGSQVQPVAPTAPTTSSAPGSYYLYPGTPSPGWWNAPTNPWSIGAGTSEQGYGWGVPGFGQDPIKILTEYLPYLQSQATGQRGGYIPGSGTFNQFRLDQPGLVGTVAGVPNTNLRYGMGGTGDPTTGLEEQTPEQWVQGGPLFEWQLHSQGKLPRDVGMDPLTTLFMRSDTPSGINTAAWSAPPQNWAQLAEAIAKGYVKPTERGWQALAAKNITPQSIGGAAPGMAGAAGAGGAGGQGGVEGAYASIIAMQQAQIAAQIAYQEWQMRTGDEGLAMQKAQQAWSQKFQEVGQAFAQRATTAGITGQWDGQDTMAMQQQRFAQDLANRTFAEQQLQNQNATGLGLLQAQSALQGPRDWARYWQMSASAPQGLTSALSSLAGRYNFAPGAQGTPGPATLQSRTQDLLSGGQQGAGAPAGAAGTGDGQAGNAWGWNLANWQRMSPSMQQGVLGAAEAGGAYGPDIERLLAQAAPRYTGPATAGIGL